MSSTPVTRPASRYGRATTPKKPSGAVGKVVAVALTLLVIGIILFGARYLQQRESVPVSASMVTYERLDDETMRLWVDVAREDPSQPSYCIVTALNYAMAEVGRREVIMPAGGESQTRMQVDLPTRDLPVSGGVYGCSMTIPAYMNIEDPTYTAR